MLRLENEDGHVGYGEVRGNVHYVTGDTQGRVLAVLRELLAPALVEYKILQIQADLFSLT